MKIKNTIAAICGVILIACMAAGLPVFAAENDDVTYIDIDGDGLISDAERDYCDALKAMQDYQERYAARVAAGIYSEQTLEEAQAEAEIQAIEESGSVTEETTEAAKETKAATTSTWSGQKLTKLAGTVMGPSGKEVYYNLNMTPVIELAQSRGVEGSFWVRNDGVKMYGNYVMAAVSYDVHPYGSTFETSLGTAIALDTGGFAASNPTMIDIAVRW